MDDTVPPCSRCRKRPRRATHRWCKECQAERFRETRRKWSELTEEEKRKAKTRGHTNMLIKRGEITRQPCADCGAPKAEVHHPDYGDPRNVVWLCRPHHMRLHAAQAEGKS